MRPLVVEAGEGNRSSEGIISDVRMEKKFLYIFFFSS